MNKIKMPLGYFAKTIVKPLHRSTIMGRRLKVLSHHLSNLLPPNQHLVGLDVGCGTGELAKAIQQLRPQIKMDGIDIHIRQNPVIEVKQYNGDNLPLPNKSYDFTLLIDVLHHTDDPSRVLQECARVSRKFILVKDHWCESWWDRIRLQFMDWVGNRADDVNLPYNYLSRKNWEVLHKQYGLVPDRQLSQLNLYPQPLALVFDGNLHFLALLKIPGDHQK